LTRLCANFTYGDELGMYLI